MEGVGDELDVAGMDDASLDLLSPVSLTELAAGAAGPRPAKPKPKPALLDAFEREPEEDMLL